MKKIILNSYAKLNLYLKVLNKRNDGYHNIDTIFERINLCDKIVLDLRPDKKIKLICVSSQIPLDASNLACRAAQLLQDSCNLDKGVDIRIIKRIPVGGGMGGGSSNAATVLTGLNKLWGLNLNRRKLVAFAKKLGADVPFFIYDAPFAFGSKRGDRIMPLNTPDKTRFWHILVVPRIRVSTQLIYKKWDGHSALTIPQYDVKLLTSALRKSNLSLLGKTLFNSLEPITTQMHPEIRRVKEKLAQIGLESTLMSGSGPAVFGFVSSRKEALSLCRRLKENRSWQVFATKTL